MRRSRIRIFCAWARAECRVHVSSRRLRTWLPNPHRKIGRVRERPFECCDDRFYTKQGHGWPRWTHKQREQGRAQKKSVHWTSRPKEMPAMTDETDPFKAAKDAATSGQRFSRGVMDS